MREILFRGIMKSDNSRCKRGQWVFGDLVRLQDGNDGKPHIYGYGEVLTETVGQYIGLNDKNGTKIFEGDVVEFTVVANRGLVRIRDECTVIYNPCRGGFCLFKGTEKCFSTMPLDASGSIEEIRVIGNIYDNPDLIK